MSRRPNIQSAKERVIERAIQVSRRLRSAANRKASGTSGAAIDPYIRCYGRGPVTHVVPKEVQRWIDTESRAQMVNYRSIVAAMNRLSPLREQWVRAFFERITGPRGYSVNAGQRRTIAAGEISARPRRAWRVVW